MVVLLLCVGLFEMKLGNLNTSEALSDAKSAFLIGLMCGLVESKIAVKVYNRATLL